MRVRARGEYHFLSNMAKVPHGIERFGVSFPTVEHAYVAMALGWPYGPALSDKDYLALSPAEVKRLRRDYPTVEDWDERKVSVMLSLLHQKFAPGTTLAKKLLDTGNDPIVIIVLHHDNFWEDCHCQQVTRDEAKYGRRVECEPRGSNVLGHLLTIVREELRARK